MNKFFKALLIVLSLSLIIVPVTYASYLYITTKGAINQSFTKTTNKSNLRDNEVNPAMDHVSVLFLGIDDSLNRRQNGQKISEARTDAMILATFNRDKKQIRLVSIPRDTLSYIPSVGYYDKITHAHADGGPESSMKAVEQLFNVPVDYYARINMQAFVDIVDELGGIYFKVPFDIDEPSKSDKGRIKVKKGYRLINGDEALALARSRHIDTDLGRGRRQMQMIEAIVKKAKETNSLSKLDDLVAIVGDNAKHNMTFDNIKSLASYYSANDVKFKRTQLKGTDYMYDGVYYYNPVFDNVFDISRLVRDDLALSKPKREDLLDYKVISLYDNLIPLKKIDIDDLNKEYKQLKNNSKKKTTDKKIKATSEEPTSEKPTSERTDIRTSPTTTETATTEPPVVFEQPTTEQVRTESQKSYEFPVPAQQPVTEAKQTKTNTTQLPAENSSSSTTTNDNSFSRTTNSNSATQ